MQPVPAGFVGRNDYCTLIGKWGTQMQKELNCFLLNINIYTDEDTKTSLKFDIRQSVGLLVIIKLNW